MTELTIEDLKEIMRKAAGEDESIDLEQDILDTPFAELGFDSLALLETVVLVKRRCGVAVADEELDEIHTPRALLTKINSELAPA